MAQNQNTLTSFYAKHKKTLNLILRCLIVFIIPIIAGLMFYKNRELYPYGDNSLLSVDLWGQYFPMYRQFAEADSFSDAMYSWNGALGFNNFVQSAFYCRSLFLLLFKLVSIDSSLIFINIVCLLRLGFSAVTCLIFLEYKFRKKSPIIMAVSVCYGLCAYAIAFIMQFMWTDCIIYAPLILLGLELLMNGRSPLLYVIALALTIYTNFYVGFGVCLFTMFYFFAEFTKRVEIDSTAKRFHRLSNGKDLKNAVLRFILYSALSGCIIAVIAIPTLMGLSNSMSANEGQLDFSRWYHTLADYINAMLPQTEISLGYGVANIATGLFMFILVPLYFFNTSIKFRDKVASGIFLILLYAGLNYNPMDYVFNGFHFPNQLPGRWSFLFSLAIVIIAANGIVKLEGVKQKSIVSAYAVGVFFMLLYKYSTQNIALKQEQINKWIIWLTVFCVLLSLYTAISGMLKKARKEAVPVKADISVSAETESEENIQNNAPKKKKIPKKTVYRIGTAVLSLAIAGFITIEMCSNTIDVASEINGGVGVSNMTHYLNATNLFTKYGELTDCGSNDFYRVENNLGWTFNDGQLGGYKGISYYGSTLNGNTFKLLRFFGNRVYAQNVSTVYNNSSTVQNSIFGIRYFIDRGKNLNERLSGINKVEEFEDCIIWENPTAFPLAFAVSADVRNFVITDQIRPITTQNNLVNMMYGEEINVFEKQTNVAMTYENAQLDESDDWNMNYFYCQNTTQPTKFSYTYVCQDENPVYIEQNFRAGQMYVNIGDSVTEISVGTEPFKNIGSYPAGTEINISVEVTGIGIGCFGVDFYSFNMDKWQTVYDKLSSCGLEVTSFKNTKVEGTMTMENPGIVFTTIPQDDGWKVYVDGKQVDDFLIANTLIGFRLGAGTHEITFKYHVPGYAFGLTITIIAILITAFCIWYRKNGGKLHKRKVPVNDSVKADAVHEEAAEANKTQADNSVKNENESSKSEDSDIDALIDTIAPAEDTPTDNIK